MYPILLFGGREDEERLSQLNDTEVERLQGQISHSAARLHQFWLERRGDARPRVLGPQVRSSPKTGRTDPCPCGSGKKYKKCCLH